MKKYNFGQFGKAAFAFVAAFGGALVTVMVAGVGFSELEDGQLLAAALAGLTASGGVYGIKYVPRGSKEA